MADISIEKENFLEKNKCLIMRCLFFVFSVLFLGVFNFDYLLRLQESSYFIGNDIYFREEIRQTGGLLMYVSAFLTQFFYYPILGAIILTVILMSVEILLSKLFNLKYLSYLPVILLLLAETTVGYALYDRFDASFVFSSALGILCVLNLFLLYRKNCNNKICLSLSIVVSVLSYFIIGSYSIVSTLLILIDCFYNKKEGRFLVLILSFLLLAFSIYIGARFLNYEFYSTAFYSPLPSPYFSNLFWNSIVLFILILFLPLLQGKDSIPFMNKFFMPYVVMLVSFALFLMVSFRDKNFNIEVKMQNLTDQHKWKEMIKLANEVERPTKSIYAYRAIALANENILSRSLFNYVAEFDKIKSSYLSDEPIFYEDFFIYTSFLNEAYLWSMEFWTTNGYKYCHLKKMVLYSILNEEFILAKKYNDLLKMTLFQKKWADEYDSYIKNPNLLYAKYPELYQVKQDIPIQENISKLDGVRNVYHTYSLLSLRGSERRLLMDLYKRDMKSFMKDVAPLKNVYKKSGLPSAVKEALVICAINGNPQILKGFNVEKGLANDVNDFFKKLHTFSSMGEAQVALKEKYEHTYSYFFVFANN